MLEMLIEAESQHLLSFIPAFAGLAAHILHDCYLVRSVGSYSAAAQKTGGVAIPVIRDDTPDENVEDLGFRSSSVSTNSTKGITEPDRRARKVKCLHTLKIQYLNTETAARRKRRVQSRN